MCGIAGIVALELGRSIVESEIRAMLPPLQHRGPDGSGVHLGPGIGLGHVRLSIVDLAGGAQPIYNETGSICVSFNGEIFNHVELRAELEAAGHRFRSHSDTEVIVHAYEQFGDDFVQHLNGQFAIALWDSECRRLLLVRDRTGILPLFFTQANQRLLFASEVKGLLPLLPAAPVLDPVALDQLFSFWAPVSPRTLFRGIKELSPGHMLIVEGGQVRDVCYWDWQFPVAGNWHQGSDASLADELYELLADATRIRLRADVPVGAYLSGGLDSSALVALIRRHSSAPLKTFSIGFTDTSLDESGHQQTLINALDLEHHRTLCSNTDIGVTFFDTIRHTESPVLRTAPVPMRLLSGLVRSQGYKVVLTGEGSDEVLGGYDIFKEAKIRQFWAQQPDSCWRAHLLGRLYPWLDSSGQQGIAYLRKFYGVGMDRPDAPLFSHLTRFQTTAQCKQFFSKELQSTLGMSAEQALTESLPSEMSRWHPFNRSQYLEMKTLMPGYLLNAQGDRMLMGNSVEGRFPFLDHRVIEFAARLHPSAKMRGLNEKYLLKRAMAGLVPSSIIDRHKQPYRAPDIPAFFTGTPPEYVSELLSEKKVRDAGYFDPQKVGLLVNKARQGRAFAYRDNMALVGILSTQIWHHHFVDGHARQARDCFA
ncbi:MAG: asparagine synthase (glutamine-hydrolyzing) [Rhodocyclaceae bacterium]